MELLDQLSWRYATKRMNGAKVPAVTLDKILDAIRLAPSSMGLQPYTILVVESAKVRELMHPAAYNQAQILEASHVLVFAAWENFTASEIDAYLGDIARERKVALDTLHGFKQAIENAVAKPSDALFQWNARQAYIALGVGVVAAAALQVDATPMEGFNGPALDEVLGLKEKGLRSVALLALGYRDPEQDHLAKVKKVRRSKERLFEYVS